MYRFLNIKHEVIYVGRTNNLKRRLIRENFTERGHLKNIVCIYINIGVEKGGG